jgi:hypothetical protein
MLLYASIAAYGSQAILANPHGRSDLSSGSLACGGLEKPAFVRISPKLNISTVNSLGFAA